MKVYPNPNNSKRIDARKIKTHGRVFVLAFILFMGNMLLFNTLQAQNAGGIQQGTPTINSNQFGEKASNPLLKAMNAPGSEEKEDEDSGEEKDKDAYDGAGEAVEFEFQRTKNPVTGKIPKEGLLDAIYQTVRAKQTILPRAATLTWAERGPYTDVVGPTNGNTRPNNGITSGRIRALWVDLSDNTGKTVWAGGVDGGLWKTTDITAAAPNWTLVNDYLSNLAVSGICQDPTNLNTMYFCTGEAYYNADRVRGDGVFKSTDAGATWTRLSSTASYLLSSKILCDAAGNVYLGTNLNGTGLLRSTNGGTTWTTITPTGLTTNITDFEISSTGRFHVAVGYYETGGGYRYTDNPSTVTSATWTSATTPFTYPSGTAARVELACSGNTLYAVPSNTGAVMTQIFKSTDGGATWTTNTLTTTNITDLNGSTTSGQAWYCIGIDIDPSDANIAIVGGLNCLKTTNGGTTWSKISEWVGTTGQYVHADVQHIKWYDGGNKLLIASDGGVFYSADKGTTFRDRNTNLRIKQFYSCAIHPNATTSPNYFLAGAQDNGTHQLNGAGIASSVEVTGGDGAFVAIDQNEPQYQFGAYVYNQYRRSTNGGASWSSVNLSTSNANGQFINPWDYDNTNNKIYGSWAAGAFVRWDDPQTGATFSSVSIPSFNSVKVGSVMVSPYTAHQVYFGTSGGRIVKVTNANTATPTDLNITGSTMPANSYVNCINTGTDDNNLVACFSNYGVNNVWVTTNSGTSWTAIDGNLPDMPVRWAMFAPNDNTKAYIATETGVWGTELINGASTVWVPNTSFPTVRTDMLKYRASDRTIVAATHGRGLWSAIIPSDEITAPVVGAITQPTCVVPTGSVVLSGLPATGTWTLTRTPGAVTTTGTGTSTTVTGIPVGTFTYTVTNASAVTSPASTNVVINAVSGAPTAPSVGTTTQPTCSVATGIVILNGLPATGTWTLTRSPGAIATTGTGTTTTISGLAAGTYTYTVTNAANCTSPATGNIVINAQPATPTTPSVGTITQPTCSVATGSVVLSGLPASGTWTLTRSPGAITTTGTGVSYTATGIPVGTFTYSVTNDAGCTSSASGSVVINAVPGSPTAPSVGTITQPTCSITTGSVVLSGLPAGNWTINPGNITGSTPSTVISALAAGTYIYTVTNAAGCTSPSATSVVINAATGCCSTTPPTVTLTSPSNGSVAVTDLNITATASDGIGSISQVKFYWVNGISKTGIVTRTLLGTDNTAPYSFTWTNMSGGNYNIQVEAVNNCGVSAFSSVSNVYVLETMTVLITSPQSGQGFIPGSNLTIAASAISFTSRSVTKVEFYAGATKLGEDLTAPYTFLWTNVQSGSYALVAKAVDNTGGVWVSPSYYIVGINSRNELQVENGYNANGLSLNVSPNPARNEVVLNTQISQEGEYIFMMTDALGKVVLNKKANYNKGANNETLNISNFPKGMYVIRLLNTERTEYIAQKLIIE